LFCSDADRADRNAFFACIAAAGLGAKASIPNSMAKPNVAAGSLLVARAADNSGVLTTTGCCAGGRALATAAAMFLSSAVDNTGSAARIWSYSATAAVNGGFAAAMLWESTVPGMVAPLARA